MSRPAATGGADPFALALFDEVLNGEALAGLSTPRKQFLAEEVLPVLFEALPALARAAIDRKLQLSGDLPTWRYDARNVAPIEPVRWLAEYLFRHNPRHEQAGTIDDPRLRQSLRCFAQQKRQSEQQQDEGKKMERAETEQILLGKS